MNCRDLQNNSSEWLSCDHLDISNTISGQTLPENFFDIEVLDEQDTQIQQFEGSEQGTTIENLQPSTYTVNEIKNPTFADNQLVESPVDAQECIDQGFDGGGGLVVNTDPSTFTSNTICFEYEDEQGNDCTTITIAAGEEKTCIVKNA